jgi:predicted transcriptional regulator
MRRSDMYTLGDLVTLKRKAGALTPVVTVGPGDTVREAVRLMMAEGYSQLPVVSAGGGRVEGVISTASIVHALYHLHDAEGQRSGPAQDPLGLSVSQCTAEKALHPADTDMLEIGDNLARTSYMLVEEGGSLVDIPTHADLVDVF